VLVSDFTIDKVSPSSKTPSSLPAVDLLLIIVYKLRMLAAVPAAVASYDK